MATCGLDHLIRHVERLFTLIRYDWFYVFNSYNCFLNIASVKNQDHKIINLFSLVFSFPPFVIMFIQPYNMLIAKRTAAKFSQCSMPSGLYVFLLLLTRQINGSYFQVIISWYLLCKTADGIRFAVALYYCDLGKQLHVVSVGQKQKPESPVLWTLGSAKRYFCTPECVTGALEGSNT